jgi:hypothetical protein
MDGKRDGFDSRDYLSLLGNHERCFPVPLTPFTSYSRLIFTKIGYSPSYSQRYDWSEFGYPSP